MTLYEKYRPKSFDEIIGNEIAVKKLQKMFSKKEHPHVFLLSGPPGTGKTTIARILAKELGAEGLDIRENNSSSNRGIDTARNIIKEIEYAPMYGDCIVYIFDEMHKATSDFMNAMLKPCEDTPEHIYFFFCTTDPDRMIKPLRQRCTEIKMIPLENEQIYKLVKSITKKEKNEFGTDVYMAIAEAAEGSARKALVILQDILSLDNDKERLKAIKENVLTDEDPDIIALCRILIKSSNWKEVAGVLKNLKNYGKLDDSETVRRIVMGYASAVLLNSGMKRAAIILDEFSEPTFNTGYNGIVLASFKSILS